MATVSTERTRRVFVLLNPKSGSCDRDVAKATLERHLGVVGTACAIHEPKHSDHIKDLVRDALQSGCDLVVAAGGDGTVSGVAEGLVGTDTPLGIVPLGTANVLARDLGIPVELEAACALLAGEHDLAKIDTMEIAGKHYFTQVGVGIDALMIRDTKGENKRRFGRAAYLWTALTRLIGFRPRQFTLTTDGVARRRHASQVIVANSGILGQPPFVWGPGIKTNDGRLDLCVVRAASLLDYAGLTFDVLLRRHRRNPNVRYETVRREVTIATKAPLPVQADGEIVGETPVTVRIVPGAVRVVVPKAV